MLLPEHSAALSSVASASSTGSAEELTEGVPVDIELVGFDVLQRACRQGELAVIPGKWGVVGHFLFRASLRQMRIGE